MKLLSCQHCSEGFATTPDGQPYTIGRAPMKISAGHVFAYKCARCKRLNRLDASDYAVLQPMRLKDLQRLEIGHVASRDLLGAGLDEDQVEQLFEANLLVEEVAGR